MAAFSCNHVTRRTLARGWGSAGGYVASPAAPEPAIDDATTEDAPRGAPDAIDVPAVASVPKPPSAPNYAMIAASVGLLLVVLGSLTGVVAIVGAVVVWWAFVG